MATVGPGDRPLSERPTTASKVVEVVENVGAAERREHDEETGREDTSTRVAAGGSTVEALAGAAAVILAILGLANVETGYMLTISVIAIGIALLAEGAAIASRHHEESTVAEAGMSAEFLGGLAGIVLGVLALLGVQVIPLTAAAVLVFGGALLVGAGAGSELASTVHPNRAETTTRRASMGAAGAKVLVALAVIVLGVLALVGLYNPVALPVNPAVLLLVATLSLGGVLLLSGLAIGSRMFAALRY